MKTSTFFTKKLALWHTLENSREMPWKGEKDPYKIWLSEIILQQTKVEQGMRYYYAFIKRFPTVCSLAEATDVEVYKLWEGLGYYSRCKNLLKTARIVCFEQNGIFPDRHENLLNLPGIGPYTAAAIASFAYGLRNAVVDGNVMRVIARYMGAHIAIDTTKGRKFFAATAAALLDRQSPAQHNQAIMDFGATICTPKSPACGNCVLNKHCVAYHKNLQTVLPVKEKKNKKIARYFYYVVLQSGNYILVGQRQEKDIWQQLHQFYLIEVEKPLHDIKSYVEIEMERIFSSPIKIKKVQVAKRQLLTHRIIEGAFITVVVEKKPPIPGYSWIKKEELKTLAFPRFIQEFLSTES